MGTKEECMDFVAIVRGTVDPRYIRSISSFYPNKRKEMFSNEGRVYMEFTEPPQKRSLRASGSQMVSEDSFDLTSLVGASGDSP